eukprot:m51a1_g387 hypothetical protein (580) ;mRNA; r:689749-691488
MEDVDGIPPEVRRAVPQSRGTTIAQVRRVAVPGLRVWLAKTHSAVSSAFGAFVVVAPLLEDAPTTCVCLPGPTSAAADQMMSAACSAVRLLCSSSAPAFSSPDALASALAPRLLRPGAHAAGSAPGMPHAAGPAAGRGRPTPNSVPPSPQTSPGNKSLVPRRCLSSAEATARDCRAGDARSELYELAVDAERAEKRAARAALDLAQKSESSRSLESAAECTRAEVARLEKELALMRDRLAVLDEQCARVRAEVAEAARVAHEASDASAAAEARSERARAGLERAALGEMELSAAQQTRTVAEASVEGVRCLLSRVGLGAFCADFAARGVTGAQLAAATDEDLRALGLHRMADRKRLLNALETLQRCGRLRLRRRQLEELVQSVDVRSRAVLMASTWDAEEAAEWLEAVDVSPDVKYRLLNACGEVLLQLREGDLDELGIAQPEDRADLLAKLATLRAAHFAALSEYLSAPETASDSELSEQAPSRSQAPAEAAADPQVPKEYVCPITLQIMDEPAMAQDGFIYEEAAIRKWLQGRQTSPMTGAPMQSSLLIPCKTLRAAIEAFRNSHRRKLSVTSEPEA